MYLGDCTVGEWNTSELKLSHINDIVNQNGTDSWESGRCKTKSHMNYKIPNFQTANQMKQLKFGVIYLSFVNGILQLGRKEARNCSLKNICSQ